MYSPLSMWALPPKSNIDLPHPAMRIYDINDICSAGHASDLLEFCRTCEWYEKAPGGFLTNSPQRLVNTFGNGCGINSDGTLMSDGWDTTFWTASIPNSAISIETKPKMIPSALSNIVPTARAKFREVHSDANITANTFNIAVCNRYQDPNHEIKAHTDCNDWYPVEAACGPVFASITVYPDTVPACDAEHARFQIKHDGVWHDVVLPHMSLLIMPSNIEHRVLKSKRTVKFHTRINITLRSTYLPTLDKLRNLQAVSNHCRYYNIPVACHYPSDVDQDKLDEVINIFNDYTQRHRHKPIKSIKSDTKTQRSCERRRLIKAMQLSYRINNNTVLENIQQCA